MERRHIWMGALAGAWLMAGAGLAHAQQVIGTFTWQMQPYCNVVTVSVVQQGGLFQLAGSDSLCGAGTGPITGTAVPTATGVALGFTIALPSGPAAHVSAAVSVATISGTWSDADGNGGTFVFGGNAGGSPRPAPAAAHAITTAQFAPTVYAGSGTAATVARSDHLHDDRYYTEAEADALLAGKASVGEVVVNAPGTGFTFVGESGVAGQVVTTTVAGRLLVRMNVGIGGVSCTPVQTSSIVFLTVDGVSVPGSVVNLPDAGGDFTGVLLGVTPDAVPAGAHTIAAAIECLGASTPLLSSANNPRSVTAIVMP